MYCQSVLFSLGAGVGVVAPGTRPDYTSAMPIIPDIRFSWPNGCSGALTSSWDDGTVHDRRLARLLSDHGLRATFNLNSGTLGTDPGPSWYPFVTAQEVAGIYRDHEVAAHTVTHPRLPELPDEAIRVQIAEDRRELERLVGYPVTGMALPFGAYDERVLRIARACGIRYCRPVEYEEHFRPPADLMRWAATAHHNAPLPELWARFLQSTRTDKLFYLWGHSYEFARDENWDQIEGFCAAAGEAERVWHATNMEVARYLESWRRLETSVDGTLVRNDAAVALWLHADDELVKVQPGSSVDLRQASRSRFHDRPS